MAAIILVVNGPERSLLWVSTPQLRKQARVGQLSIQMGSALLIAAAFWFYLRRKLLGVSVLVATPAVLAGGLMLASPDSLFPLTAFIALPAASIGLILGSGRSRNRYRG